MTFRHALIPAAVAAALFKPVAAADEQPLQLAQFGSGDGIVVTPTRTARSVDESLASVTVIDHDEIDRQQPKQFSDLLDGRAGLSTRSNGPFGKATNVSMRGTGSEHTLLLVDGLRMRSATLGSAPWQHLPTAQLERVEIVRGPRSSIYGADAIGGVVQAFSLEGREGEPAFNAFAGMGSFNTREGGIGVSGGSDRTRFNLSRSFFHTDGINVQEEAGDDGDDGYTNAATSFRVTHDMGERSELFVTHLQSEGHTEFDSDTQNGADYLNEVQGAGVRGQVTDSWFSEFKGSVGRDEQINYDSDDGLNTQFFTETAQLDWLNEFRLGERFNLIAGGDWMEDRIRSSSDYDETSRYNTGLYGVFEGRFGAHTLSASQRRDDNEEFGTHTTGQAAWGWDMTSTLSSRVSYGTAFKAPTFNANSGNPDLDPETSETFEVGLRQSAERFHWDAALFQTDVEDLINWVPTAAGPWQPQNVEDVRIRGAEFEAGVELAAWRIQTAFTYLDHEDRDSGNELARRPNESARLDIDRDWGDFSAGLTGIARGRSFEDTANEERLAGYGLLNLRASYAFTPAWTVRAKVDNALDKDYETAAGYNQPGRAFYASIHYQQR